MDVTHPFHACVQVQSRVSMFAQQGKLTDIDEGDAEGLADRDPETLDAEQVLFSPPACSMLLDVTSLPACMPQKGAPSLPGP